MSNSKFNHKCQNIIFAPFMMPPELWDEERLGVKWISLNNFDMRTMTDTIKGAIMDRTVPKNILVCSFQKFAGAIDIERIKEHLNELVDVAIKQKFNKLILGTAYFVPSHMAIWGAVSLLNMEIHRLCDKMCVPRGNLHKYLMRNVAPNSKVRMIRPSCFVEYQLGLSLGLMLSTEGLKKYKNCILQVFDFSFAENVWRPPSSPPKPDVPPTLEETPGFMQDKFFVQIMEDKRLIEVRTLQPGEEPPRRLKCSEVRAPNGVWRHWDIYKKHGPMWSFESREGMLEAYHMKMRRSHSDFEWRIPSAGDEDEDEVATREEDMEEDFHATDDVFYPNENNEDSDDRRGEPEKPKKKKNSNENEELERLTYELEEKSRLLKIEEEKVKSYRQNIDNKEAAMVKERALSKHWRKETEKEKARNEELLKALEKELKSARHVRKQNKRLTDEYYYLRGLYESGARSRGKVTHAPSGVFDEDADNEWGDLLEYEHPDKEDESESQ